MVDSAINHFPNRTEIADLADSLDFHVACERDNELFAYPVVSWAPPLARTALSNPALSQLYVNRQVRAALSGLRLDPRSLPQLLPDVAGIVRMFWSELSPGFRPGTIIGGEVESWGYEAYLAKRLTPMVTSAVGRGLRWSWSTCPIIDEERERFPAKQSVDRWEGHLRFVLVEALDALIDDELLHNAYFALAYGEEPMREIACSLGVSYHYLHTRLLQPLCVRITKAAELPMKGHVRICGELRAALAEVLPIDEFEARYRPDRPSGSGNTLAANANQWS